ncbi:MAG: serine/threonine-protein kinase [Streptosporangiaceae bacterium]
MPQPALVEPLRRWDPEQIGGYVLVGRLGAGAMGRVYLGRSAAGRLVAVKTIKIELADEPDFRTRFAQEVAAARRVSGAFTAAVVAADPEADLPWLATAYVPAPALSSLVRACGPLPVLAVRWLAAGCAEALESIHSAGLVHRDLKPSNVLVSPDGPRVIDFGVARAAERIQLTVTRGAVGTPAYMAPEQARDTRQATMASDVFSLGATMLFAATGHAPYQGETVMDVLVRLATEPPDLSGLPPEIADVVISCLERDPRRRPTSAAVLAQLAPGNGSRADARDFGPSSLPASALALIAEYRRDPQPAAEPGPEASEDATFGSQPALSLPRSSPGHRAGGPRRPGRWWSRLLRPGGLGGSWGSSGGAARPGRPSRRRVLVIAGSAAAAIVLIAAGALIGADIAGRTPPPVPAGQLPPGVSPPPPVAGRPQLSMGQLQGDSHTDFVVNGAGWKPGETVTISVSGVRHWVRHQLVDTAGNFHYGLNQDGAVPGGLPVGTYRVAVTSPDGLTETAGFFVGRR